MQRITKQRKAILSCLSESGRPLSVEEILASAAVQIPQINLSTVYRTIKKLVEENVITFVELPGEKACYEIIQKEHHHYFSCDSCGRIFFIHQCPKGLLDIVPNGFVLFGHSITLNGYCRECHHKGA